MSRKKSKLATPSPAAKKKSVDWNGLWSKASSVYEAAGMDRLQAVLNNFRDQKEEICRALGIVSEADLARIQRRISEQTDRVKGA